MKPIVIGTHEIYQSAVADEMTAANVGSGTMDVLSTPVMINLMECAAVKLLAPYMTDDETTVGVYISVSHVSATPVGRDVYAKAVVTGVNGREISFDIMAYDEKGLIGTGNHTRVIVYPEVFLRKMRRKFEIYT